MTEKLIEWLRGVVIDTELFESVHGLAELVQDGSKVYPVTYEGDGELVSVHEQDISDGIAYFRILDITDQPLTFDESCADVETTYKALLFASVEKGLYSLIGDDSYSTHRAIEIVKCALWDSDLPRRNQRPVEARIRVAPRRIKTGLNMLKTEYSGFPDYANECYKTGVFGIEFDIVVTGKKDCICS